MGCLGGRRWAGWSARDPASAPCLELALPGARAGGLPRAQRVGKGTSPATGGSPGHPWTGSETPGVPICPRRPAFQNAPRRGCGGTEAPVSVGKNCRSLSYPQRCLSRSLLLSALAQIPSPYRPLLPSRPAVSKSSGVHDLSRLRGFSSMKTVVFSPSPGLPTYHSIPISLFLLLTL